MRISDWSSDVCSSDLLIDAPALPCGFSHARISAIEQVQRLGHCLTHGSLIGKAQFRAIFPSSFDRGNQRIRHVWSLSPSISPPDTAQDRASPIRRQRHAHQPCPPQIGSEYSRDRGCQYGVISVVAVAVCTKTYSHAGDVENIHIM